MKQLGGWEIMSWVMAVFFGACLLFAVFAIIDTRKQFFSNKDKIKEDIKSAIKSVLIFSLFCWFEAGLIKAILLKCYLYTKVTLSFPILLFIYGIIYSMATAEAEGGFYGCAIQVMAIIILVGVVGSIFHPETFKLYSQLIINMVKAYALFPLSDCNMFSTFKFP